jgi:hypothetical protein
MAILDGFLVIAPIVEINHSERDRANSLAGPDRAD